MNEDSFCMDDFLPAPFVHERRMWNRELYMVMGRSSRTPDAGMLFACCYEREAADRVAKEINSDPKTWGSPLQDSVKVIAIRANEPRNWTPPEN